MPNITTKRCITPDCAKPVPSFGSQGLCTGCYSRAKKMVESGQTSWDELEALGLIVPKEDAFTKAFNKAKEQ